MLATSTDLDQPAQMRRLISADCICHKGSFYLESSYGRQKASQIFYLQKATGILCNIQHLGTSIKQKPQFQSNN